MKEGFSLLELIIVLFLIGLILFLSYPDLRALYEKHLFDGEINKIRKLFLKTYYLSSQKGKVYTVTISEGEFIFPFQKYKLPQGYEIQGGASIVFYPDGRTSGGQWIITENGFKEKIVVKMFTGEVELKDLP